MFQPQLLLKINLATQRTEEESLGCVFPLQRRLLARCLLYKWKVLGLLTRSPTLVRFPELVEAWGILCAFKQPPHILIPRTSRSLWMFSDQLVFTSAAQTWAQKSPFVSFCIQKQRGVHRPT